MPGYSDTDGYDRVGNRRKRTVQDDATVPVPVTIGDLAGKTYAYDDNDRLTGSGNESDANGNTLVGEVPDGAVAPTETYTDEYDYENRLIKRSNGTSTDDTTITIVYDGDGNRVKKTIAVVGGSTTTTYFVVDTRNPTGYAQVLEEWESTNGEVSWDKTRSYLYGHDLISQERISSGTLTGTDYYGYDGHGNVRFLIDAAGVVKDTYTYDAFGTIIYQTDADGVVIGTTGTFNITPNKYLYCGEQWDSDLGFYYLRARYLNPNSGRFWTMDFYEGSTRDPLSLHKYLYCHGNPVNNWDPSGRSLAQKVPTMAGIAYLMCQQIIAAHPLKAAVIIIAMSMSFPQLEAIPPGTPGPLDEMGQIGRVGRGGLGLTKYIKSIFQNRRVYKNETDFILGVPEFVDEASGRIPEAVLLRLKQGATNVDLMREGYAPIGIDGIQMQLHHVLGEEPGPLVELLSTTHDQYRKPLHGMIEAGRSWRSDPKKLAEYAKFRDEWWKGRAIELSDSQ